MELYIFILLHAARMTMYCTYQKWLLFRAASNSYIHYLNPLTAIIARSLETSVYSLSYSTHYHLSHVLTKPQCGELGYSMHLSRHPSIRIPFEWSDCRMLSIQIKQLIKQNTSSILGLSKFYFVHEYWKNVLPLQIVNPLLYCASLHRFPILIERNRKKFKYWKIATAAQCVFSSGTFEY